MPTTAVLAVSFALVVSAPSLASPIQLAERAALAGDDYFDWGVMGASFAEVPLPITVPAALSGLSLALDSPNSNDINRLDEGNGWQGRFALGDKLLWTRGPLVVSFRFDSPVRGVGAAIEPEFKLPFIARIRAFDAMEQLLAAFEIQGNTALGTYKSAMFLGVRDDQPSIHRIEYSATRLDQSDPQPVGFAINRLDVLLVPEPTAAVLWGFALFSLSTLPFLRRFR